MQSINPFTKQHIATYKDHSLIQATQIVEKAHISYLSWKNRSVRDRSENMIAMAGLLRKNRESLAKLITDEMGKIIRESKAEIDKCAWLCEFYAENTEEFLLKEHIETDAANSYIQFDPIGVIYAIMPWNFPFWQVLRFAVPTIMAGNTVVLKHAPNVTGCALAIEKIIREAGFQDNVFRCLLIPVDLSKHIISNPLIRGVTLTGSIAAGKTVAAQAGKNLKKCVLELGGSDPYIVLKDADLKQTCKIAVASRMLNAGQVCIAAKRFIVEKPVYNTFVSEHKTLLEKLKTGDPLMESTDIGPLARPDLLDHIDLQVNKSISLGAGLVTGGKKIDNTFYTPTLLTNVKKGMPVVDEETFGPVSVVLVAEDAEDAVRIANDTSFGLGASIWTNDIRLAGKMANKIEAGVVFINGMVKSDPRLPFGGVKNSGYGRELSLFGIREFLNIKTVWIK